MQFTSSPVTPVSKPPPKTYTASVLQAGFSLLGSAGLMILALRFVWRGLSWISKPQIPRSEITGSIAESEARPMPGHGPGVLARGAP